MVQSCEVETSDYDDKMMRHGSWNVSRMFLNHNDAQLGKISGSRLLDKDRNK